MKQKTKTLPDVLGIDDADGIIEQCLMWQVTETDLGEILKKVMCSDYNSKEMLFAAFCIGKMQNADKEHIEGMMMFMTMRRIKELIDNKNDE